MDRAVKVTETRSVSWHGFLREGFRGVALFFCKWLLLNQIYINSKKHGPNKRIHALAKKMVAVYSYGNHRNSDRLFI
jgi:hypothetical protein